MLSGPAGSAAAVMLRARGEGAGVPRRPWRDLLTRIGRTPLLALDAVGGDLPGVRLLGKAEWLNPGGSVKERAAARIVLEARRSWKLRPGPAPARRHQRQHRHRLRHARRGHTVLCDSGARYLSERFWEEE